MDLVDHLDRQGGKVLPLFVEHVPGGRGIQFQLPTFLVLESHHEPDHDRQAFLPAAMTSAHLVSGFAFADVFSEGRGRVAKHRIDSPTIMVLEVASEVISVEPRPCWRRLKDG